MAPVYTTASSYDNYWVQHSIPRSDLQYSWLTASFISYPEHAVTYGHAPADGIVSSSTKGFVSAYNFVSASEEGVSGSNGHIQGTLFGLNNLIYDPIDKNNNILSASSVDYRNTALGTLTQVHQLNLLLLHRNGPYQYPSFKQMRTGETAIPRFQRKRNILTIQNTPQTFVISDNLGQESITPLRSDGFTKYKEPAVTSKNKPVEQVFEVTVPGDGFTSDSTTELGLVYSYGNVLNLYANKEINDINGFRVSTNQVYNDLVNLYDFSIPGNPINNVLSFKYNETVYPREVNTFLSRSRGRVHYTEITGTTSRGYDRRPDQRRTFWRDTNRNRRGTNRTILNAMGQIQVNNKTRSIAYVYQSGALSLWPLDGTRPNYVPDDMAVDYEGKRYQGTLGQTHKVNEEFGELKTPIYNHIAAGPRRYADNDNDVSMIRSASLQYIYPTMLVQRGTTFDTAVTRGFHSGSYWYANQQANRNPWFDSYEDYSDDIKRIGKDYTVIPEFRISDHIANYLEDPDGFLSQQKDFLKLDGGEVSSSAEEQFYTLYSHTDFLNHFEVFERDHGDFPNKKITLKCKGIKKLLPYNGFYPVTRTVQLGAIFSQSIGPHITSSVNIFHRSNRKTTTTSFSKSSRFYHSESLLRLQCLMEPLFAPGILYNTIKAGVAVDYPIFSGNLPTPQSASGGTLASASLPYRLQVYESPRQQNPATVKTIPNFVWTGSSGYLYRLPFESLVDLGEFPINSDIFLSHPVVQNQYAQGRAWYMAGEPRQPRARWTGQINKNYSLAMNNFLAEVPNFFLERKGFTTIYSKPEREFLQLETGKTYYMDVTLHKTDDFVMCEGTVSATFILSSSVDTAGSNRPLPSGKFGAGKSALTRSVDRRGRIFGPNFVARRTGTTFKSFDTDSGSWYAYTADPAYAPHSPPYLYGKSRVRLAFKPYDGSRQYFLDEIVSHLTATYSNDSWTNTASFSSSYGTNVLSNWQKTPAGEEMMHLSSSVELFGKSFALSVEYDRFGNPIVVKDPEQASDNGIWTISTKFETPILNFPESSKYPQVNYNRGMWHGLGYIPSASSGIYLSIEDSYPETTLTDSPTTGSLINALGFENSRLGSGYQQKLGIIATQKEISEAIVAVPFILSEGRTQFFAIEREQINDALGQGRKGEARTFEEVPEAGTSIREMVRLMGGYVFPPTMDFLRNEDLQSFAMYIFEFTHTLSKQDLAYVWQNLMPDISISAQLQEVEFSHSVGPGEFFGPEGMPTDIRWMVFKVKKRANDNYFKVTSDSTDDDRFQFDLNIGGSTVEGLYSHNWPYDFFSLVELAKVDAGITYENNIEEIATVAPAISDLPEPS